MLYSLSSSIAATSKEVELISRQVLLGNPERMNPLLSSDGQYLAYIAPDRQNILQIFVRFIAGQDDRPVTSDRKQGIRDYMWVYGSGQLIYAQDADGDENYHLYLLDIDSRETRDITPFKGIQAQLVALDPKFSRTALVAMNLKNPEQHDVYRLDLDSGKMRLAATNPGNVVEWISDAQLRVRAATAATADGGYNLLVRDSESKPFRCVQCWGSGDSGEVIGFSEDGRTLYATASYNANVNQLLAFDLASNRQTVLAQDPQYDVDKVLVDPRRGTIQAVSFYRERCEWQVLDESVATDFTRLARVQRGQFSIVSRDLKDGRWIVAYDTDDGPVRYYDYRRDTKSAALLFSHQRELEGLALARIEPIRYHARDGLLIHGYLTLPVGKAKEKLPTVLLVHGGPEARDRWGFNAIVQWLANRGYAVMQVNFRGSTGYGRDFLDAGDHEWGGKMQDDLIDGVKWAVGEGIADPGRIAIMGISYGGYAALVGLTQTPDLFACGIDIAGPSNLSTLIESVPPYWQAERAQLEKRIGKVRTEASFLKSRSPLFFADRITAPLLIGQGANDPRVKPTESEAIVAQMRKLNKPVTYILYPDEGHGFARRENTLHFFANAEAFLSKCLGGRLEPLSEIKGHSGILK